MVELDPRLGAIFRSFSRTAALLVALFGAVALAGWFAGADILKSGFPGMVGMKVNTALCLIVSGLATWLLVEVRDGDAALAQLRRAASEGEPFESVIAGMHMPGLTGLSISPSRYDALLSTRRWCRKQGA